MKIRIKFFSLAIIAIGLLGLTGCAPDKPLFETPPWLGGSSIETLEAEGNYTSFLALMDSANYREPISKQLYTLFVPDDAAFAAYFAKIGKNSVADLTEAEATQLFTLHVLRNPRSRFLLIYEYVYNEFQGPDHGHNGEYMSLYHRKRTPSVTTPYVEHVRYFEQYKGQDLLMTSGSKYVPLFTEEWFHDYGSFDAEGDYLFMYPNSSWKKDYEPGMIGTNWHSAMVLPHENKTTNEKEIEVRTASGFIYFIDRVVEPMPSLDEYLKKNEDKYGVYYDILQRFAKFSASGSTPDGRTLYTKSYDLVYNLADEFAASPNAGVNFPQNLWTAFIPNNTVLQEYLDNSILKTYPSLDSVPRVTLYYLLQTHLSKTVVLMSQMERAYFNAFGDRTDLKRTDLYPGYMTSNGVIYESKKVIEPNVFSCVPGLLFKDRNYSTLLFVLSKADALITLANPDKDVTLLASTNEQLEEYGVRYDAVKDVIEFRSPANGTWSAMSTEELVAFAQSQILQAPYSDFSGNGFIRTLSGSYINYSNNVIQGSENMNNGASANFVETVPNERNGYLIKLDKPIEVRYTLGQFVANNQPKFKYNDVSPYNEDVDIFYKLMVDLSFINDRNTHPVTREQFAAIKFSVTDKNWTVFVPTDNAMRKAIEDGIIPDVTATGWKTGLSGASIDSLKNWVNYHFVKGDVIFDDGNLSGSFDTNISYIGDDGKTTLYKKININNDPNNLSILDATGNVTVVNHSSANILVKEGVVHKIDSVFRLYE